MRLLRLAINSLETLDSLCPRLRSLTTEALRELPGSNGASLIPLLESAPDAILVVNDRGEIAQANQLAGELFGYSSADLIGEAIELLVPEDLRRFHSEQRLRYLADPKVRPMGNGARLQGRRRDGMVFPVEVSLGPARVGPDQLVVATVRDVSQRDQVEQELRFLADHDPLTGLRNRRRFQQDLAEQIGRARRYDEQAALLVIDVDGFKSINDAHGHAAGDVALQAISQAIRERLRQSDILARIGGDEFAVLLLHTDDERAAKVAADLKGVVARSMRDQDARGLEISVGIAAISGDTRNDDALLSEADQAMYRDKASRRGDPA
jgi:diguanylate cyclase (GGDEF)-like protein/PAS domain S-box-containing protein